MRPRKRKGHISEHQRIECYDLLADQLEALNLPYQEDRINTLLDYACLLFQWNHAYNLTSIRHIETLVSRHLVDSLSLLPYIKENQRILDVGAGAGLPGIPLAIMRDDLKIALLHLCKTSPSSGSKVSNPRKTYPSHFTRTN